MSRAICVIPLFAWLCSSASVAAPLYAGEVWPSKVSVQTDGSLEYVYDLRGLKVSTLPPDVQAEAGEEAAKAFLKGLPNTVRLVADPSTAALSVSAPGELEHSAPVASFAASPSGAWTPPSEFEKPAHTAKLPALHHDTPKVLPSVDMLLWKSRQVEDGVLAAVLSASERGALGLPMGRRAFWNAVLASTVRRYHSVEGDARDGAVALAARVGAALRASEGQLPGVLSETAVLAEAAEHEAVPVRSTDLNPGLVAAYNFTSDIGDLDNSESVLGRPMADSRPGLAGALVFLSTLEKDARLAKSYSALRGLRDDFLGPAPDDVLDVYKSAASEGVAKALDGMGDFLPQVEAKRADWNQPRLFAPPQTPIRGFLGSLEGAERGNALDELAAALQDGRVAPDAAPKGSWAILREASLVPLFKPEEAYGGKLVISGSYRARLSGAFRALFRSGFDSGQDTGGDATSDEPGTPVLKVRLQVPPNVQVEPLPSLYGRLAVAYQRLAEALAAHGNAGGVQGLTQTGGRRPSTARAEAGELARLYRGLELVALRGAGPLPLGPDTPAEQRRALATAERFLSGWRNDFDLGRNVRGGASGDEAQLSVTRRQLDVSFDGTPKTQVVGFTDEKTNPFVADTTASQGYLVPVLTLAVPGALPTAAHGEP
jgi:hypothetical protein